MIEISEQSKKVFMVDELKRNITASGIGPNGLKSDLQQ